MIAMSFHHKISYDYHFSPEITIAIVDGLGICLAGPPR